MLLSFHILSAILRENVSFARLEYTFSKLNDGRIPSMKFNQNGCRR